MNRSMVSVMFLPNRTSPVGRAALRPAHQDVVKAVFDPGQAVVVDPHEADDVGREPVVRDTRACILF